MDSFYDSLLQELLGGGMAKNKETYYRSRPIVGAGLPQGMSEEDLAGGMHGGGFDERTARRLASGAEDVMLTGNLQSERKLGKGEHKPQGAYALSWYPGQAMDIEMAPGRVIPADAMVRMSPEQRKAWEQKMKEWQDMQRSLVPQHGSGFIRNMLGGI